MPPQIENNIPPVNGQLIDKKSPKWFKYLGTVLALILVGFIVYTAYQFYELDKSLRGSDGIPIVASSTPKIIGGDKDAGGCLIGAGYSWCAVKNKCLRVWEESCGSGIRGKVTIGPTCPVQRIPPDPNCADKPFQAGFNVNNKNGQIVGNFTSDANGLFSLELPSGEFIIRVVSAPGTYPHFEQQNQDITVLPNKYLDLNLQFDSGIR